jgi:hypothetical protein
MTPCQQVKNQTHLTVIIDVVTGAASTFSDPLFVLLKTDAKTERLHLPNERRGFINVAKDQQRTVPQGKVKDRTSTAFSLLLEILFQLALYAFMVPVPIVQTSQSPLGTAGTYKSVAGTPPPPHPTSKGGSPPP